MKVTHVQPGVVNTPMAERAFEDFPRLFNISPAAVMAQADKMLVPEDVGGVVWEAVARPGRCYQVEVGINDTMQTFF